MFLSTLCPWNWQCPHRGCSVLELRIQTTEQGQEQEGSTALLPFGMNERILLIKYSVSNDSCAWPPNMTLVLYSSEANRLCPIQIIPSFLIAPVH